MKKKFFFHTIVYAAAPKLPALANFLVLPLITPFLSLKDYGKFGLVIACYSLFVLTVTLGQRVILQNSFFEYKKYNIVWRRAYGIMTAGSIAGSVIMAVAFYYLLTKSFNTEYFQVTSICIISLICSPIEILAQVYYTMREKPSALLARSVIMSLINVLILIITIKYLKLGYVGLVTGFACSSFISLLFYLYPICIKENIYPVFFFKKQQWNKYLKIGLPLLPHYLSLSIFNTSDRILLGFFKVNVSAIGMYSQGYGLGSNAMVFNNGVFSALGKTLQVAFRNKTEKDKKQVRSIFVFLVTGIGILFFNGSLWMKELYQFLFRKPELQIGYPVAILVLMANIFFPLYSFGIFPLFIDNMTKVVAKITMIAAAANIIINLILIPFYNIWAALGSTFVSYILLCLFTLRIKEVHEKAAWVFPKLTIVYGVSILYGLLLTALAWYLKDAPLNIKIIISAFSIIISCAGFFYRKNFFQGVSAMYVNAGKKMKNI